MDFSLYERLDRQYLTLDKKLVRRTRNIRLVPDYGNRRGGKVSYGEWCHVAGIFQTLFFLYLRKRRNNIIIDAGCGTGSLAISAEPFLADKGKYIGIDVSIEDIEFCRQQYPQRRFKFQHLDVFNAVYAPDQPNVQKAWSIEDESADMVAALSLFTHLSEADAVFNFREINRVLKRKAHAIVTFFELDEVYYKTIGDRTHQESRYHTTKQDEWVFDSPICPKSKHWFHPQWADPPESGVGVTTDGIRRLLKGTGLELCATYPGNWKEIPGVFFQDVLVFRKR